MVAINRGPGVVGWDSASSKPKGVVSPSEHRGGLTALAQRAGVFYTDGSDAAIGTSASSRQLTVAPAGVAISSPLGGWYLPWWGSTLTLTPAPAGSQARIDVIYVQQADYELDGASADSAAVVDIKRGQPSATPSAPSLSEGQLALYQVRVPAGATVSSGFTISRVFQWTAPIGATMGPTDISALFTTASPDWKTTLLSAKVANGIVTVTGRATRQTNSWVARAWDSAPYLNIPAGYRPASGDTNIPVVSNSSAGALAVGIQVNTTTLNIRPLQATTFTNGDTWVSFSVSWAIA